MDGRLRAVIGKELNSPASDAETDGSAVVEVLAAAEPPGGTLRSGATQRVPGLMVNSE